VLPVLWLAETPVELPSLIAVRIAWVAKRRRFVCFVASKPAIRGRETVVPIGVLPIIYHYVPNIKMIGSVKTLLASACPFSGQGGEIMNTSVVDSDVPVGIETVEHERKPVRCPRCGTVHWLLLGESVCCHGQTDSPYGSRGICYLHIGRAGDNE